MSYSEHPMMIAIGGMSGTGKSTLAGNLAAMFPGAVVMDSDVLRKQMFGVDPLSTLPLEAYTAENTAQFILYARNEASRHLLKGQTVIVTGTFLDEVTREEQRSLALSCQADFIGLTLHAPLDELQKRINNRPGTASDAQGDVLKKQYHAAVHPSAKKTNTTAAWHQLNSDRAPQQVTAEAYGIILRDRLHPTPQRRAPQKKPPKGPKI